MSNTKESQTREEMMREYFYEPDENSTAANLQRTILTLMKQAQEAAVDEALRQAAEHATKQEYDEFYGADVDPDSILSLRSQILEKLK